MLANLPKQVTIWEVGLRDGLQNETRYISVEEKLELINGLIQSGVKNLEVTAFVNPKWVPQMKDASELLAKMERPSECNISALVPNEKGLEKALAARLNEIAVVVSASEGHNLKNLNKTADEAIREALHLIYKANVAGLRVRAYLSTAFGCPYDGPVKIERVMEISEKLLGAGAYQVSLGDTIGIAHPKQLQESLSLITRRIPPGKLALHLHDTRGMALANTIIGLEYGITTFDSSFGGLGGCPYAPGASGNVATEDLVNMLHAMGCQTGIDLDRLVLVSTRAQAILGKRLPSKILQIYRRTRGE
ncbi:hydroxymethylglutaryl-CoA lyase [Carboxydocella sporoproducens DSM 16521]|uniref:Hydroxymethylglutaryl-CoA lyase n=2 Tax=Carboxydocella TaxID=178898 RepID=A0A1T4LV23_9FIRM|nr:MULTISPECIES: hydroxymethylglutaryl-CoA lyase [Carboxydocella]AVX20626.1 hydroxymethylglutaryl-CoA lyase [Carboxydocella thermautotrophica]SJZ58525.1 hydroxymethylglutaryl-CoA lyase [Carboxydocella sporoproducens DSM 16521]